MPGLGTGLLTMVRWEALQIQTITHLQEKRLTYWSEGVCLGLLFFVLPKIKPRALSKLGKCSITMLQSHLLNVCIFVASLGKRSKLLPNDNELLSCVPLWDSYQYTHFPPKETKAPENLIICSALEKWTFKPDLSTGLPTQINKKMPQEVSTLQQRISSHQTQYFKGSCLLKMAQWFCFNRIRIKTNI